MPTPSNAPLRVDRRSLLLGGAAAALLAGCGRRTPAAAPRPVAPATTSPAPAPSPAPAATPSPTVTADAATIAARCGTVPVLCYHQLRDWTPQDSASARPYIMPPATFRAQLDALAGAGYATVSPDQLVAYLTTGAPLPPRPVLLSFDDADVDGYDVALPEMVKRGFTGTYFIMTVVLGKQRYMNTAQLRELDAAGMTLAAHTWDHHRVDRYSGDDWRVQIDQPTQELAGILGHPVRYFAYPYGAWNAAAFPHLQEAGFTAAFQLRDHPVDPTRPLYSIPRSIANPSWSTAAFLKVVAPATT